MEAKAAAMAMRKPGDWSCRSCQYVNFCKREACQRGWEVKPGDWCCRCCAVNNYASRGSCFKCGAAKNDSAAAVAQGWGFSVASQAGWKNGDWICPRMECNVQNYANRTECFRCNFPRYYG
uniref:RanBP2-type domain-containing protein n=1 Tax=Oryza barthii TaxID=65489 RepID=A0A0D3EQ27_9ORYZ